MSGHDMSDRRGSSRLDPVAAARTANARRELFARYGAAAAWRMLTQIRELAEGTDASSGVAIELLAAASAGDLDAVHKMTMELRRRHLLAWTEAMAANCCHGCDRDEWAWLHRAGATHGVKTPEPEPFEEIELAPGAVLTHKHMGPVATLRELARDAAAQAFADDFTERLDAARRAMLEEPEQPAPPVYPTRPTQIRDAGALIAAPRPGPAAGETLAA